VLRPLLILDLDETLISSTESKPAAGHDFRMFHYFVRKRPNCDAFIQNVSKWFDLAVWSASSDDYATQIAEMLFKDHAKLEFVWGRTRCTPRFSPEMNRYYHLKNLRKVKKRGFDLNRVLIIDDSAETAQHNFGNHLKLNEYNGEVDDSELSDVLPFLKWLAPHENYRNLDKRNWRSFRAV
jgi:RNA polymerase II subunit A small phosphatase-like protein